MSSYTITYCENYKALFWGIIADSRSNIPGIKDAVGNVIKSYVDSQIALVVPGVIPYKIEISGSVAGFFGLKTGGGAAEIVFLQLRPAFTGDVLAVNQQISTFISSSSYQFDTL